MTQVRTHSTWTEGGQLWGLVSRDSWVYSCFHTLWTWKQFPSLPSSSFLHLANTACPLSFQRGWTNKAFQFSLPGLSVKGFTKVLGMGSVGQLLMLPSPRGKLRDLTHNGAVTPEEDCISLQPDLCLLHLTPACYNPGTQSHSSIPRKLQQNRSGLVALRLPHSDPRAARAASCSHLLAARERCAANCSPSPAPGHPQNSSPLLAQYKARSPLLTAGSTLKMWQERPTTELDSYPHRLTNLSKVWS